MNIVKWKLNRNTSGRPCRQPRGGLRPVGAFVIWVVSSIADYAYCVWNFFVVVSILMKRLFLFVLFLSMGCTHYFVRDSSQYNLTKEELDFLKSKKIGLIGFYPYESHTRDTDFSRQIDTKDIKIENQRHLKIIRFVNDNLEKKEILSEIKNSFIWYWYDRHYYQPKVTTYRLISENLTASLLEYGEDVKKIKSNGLNKNAQANSIKLFLIDYLSETKHLGLDIVEPMFVFPVSNSKNSISLEMKKFDIDHWVIPFHGKDLSNSTQIPSLKSFFTGTLFFFTLTTFPHLSEVSIKSTFLLYDANLNKIKIYEYKNEIYSLTAWWLFWDGDDGYLKINNPFIIPDNAYKPDIKQFSKELLQVLKK